MSDQSAHVTTVPNPLADAGLRCPRCDYNLTGLPEARCPECGEVFDWDQVRRAAANPPRIYFERVHGRRKVPGFFVTWATVLFAPWIFARQAVARVSVAHAFVFVLICFGGTFVSMVSGADPAFMLTWLTTALIYIPLQALMFSILDFSGWHQPLRSLRFWLLVGCYTSAIMLTETIYGPTLLSFSDLGRLTADLWGSLAVALDWRDAVGLAQLLLWAAGLACCYATRLRRTRSARVIIVVIATFAALCALLLYGVAVEYIGLNLYDWYDHRC